MAMKRCESGHYYDTGKHKVCPICSAVDLSAPPVLQGAPPVAVVTPVGTPSGHAAHRGAGDAVPLPGATVAVMKKQKGIDPVVGWLVCTKGPDRGADYRIKGEKNFIGRAPNMDISIAHDETLSRENHAIVSYNPKKRTFKVIPGEARGLVYLNGDEIDAPREIARGDVIELGQTTLLFVPLCGDEFDWE